MQACKTWLSGGRLFAAVAGICAFLADAAVPLAHFPYLPGGPITQIEAGGEYLFAVTGNTIWVDLDVSGHYLYSRHPDSASWKLVRRASPVQTLAFRKEAIRFRGVVGERAFFNLEDSNAYCTGDGGKTFTRVAEIPFQSNVAGLGGLSIAVLDKSVHASADGGLTWTRTAVALDAEQLLIMGESVYARGAKVWSSGDSGRTWQERIDGMPAGVFSLYSGPYGLHRYGNLLVASTGQGTFMRASEQSPWAPMGTGYTDTRMVFSFGNELTTETNTRFHRYDPVLSAWHEYKPWSFSKPMGTVSLGSLCGILSLGPRWIVGHGAGLMAFDPGTEDYAWFDAGIHRAPYLQYAALPGALVAVHRSSQLFGVPPDGAPFVMRDFRRPGARSASVSLVSNNPADSILWAYADSALYRIGMIGGVPSIRDSVRVEPGRYFGDGRDLIGIVPIMVAPYLRTDSVKVRVSRDAGATFTEFPRHLGMAGSYGILELGTLAAAYLWNDTVWVWDTQGDFHAFDLATGGYRFGETSIPPPESGVPVQALATRDGMVVKMGNSILHSKDGGQSWILGTRGIPGALTADARIQKLGSSLYLSSGGVLYRSGESELQWEKIDLAPLAGASAGVSGALAAKEGIYVHRIAEDVVLLPWSDVPVAVRPFAARTPRDRARAKGELQRGRGVILRRNGTAYSIIGRELPAPRSPRGN